MSLNKAILKFSSLLYRTHIYLNKHYKVTSKFIPYKLNLPATRGSKKIIHVNGNFVIGGTSQLIVDLIEHTSVQYHHQIVVPYYSDPLPYQPVDIHQFGIDQLLALRDFLEQERPDLAHIHYWVRHIHRYEGYALWYGSIFRMCEELGIAVIQNVNVPTSPFTSGAVKHNVFVSNFVRDNFNHTEVPSSVIYPGSDFAHFSNDDIPAPATIGMVYRLDSDKLSQDSIEVFIAVAKKRPDIHTYIVGDGQFYKRYLQRVKEERLADSFTFTGYVSYEELPKYYKQIGVFVTPVHDESFGQVTPFAMSMGLTVAGYNTGALKEILGSGDTLVDYGQIEELANLIIRLVDDREKRVEKGRANILRAYQQFSVEKMINQYRTLYATCITE